MNLKLILLLVGLVVGGGAGFMTAPQPSEMQLGPLSVQTSGDDKGGTLTVTGDDNGGIKVQVGKPSMLDDRNTRTAIFAVIGAIAGLAVGFAVDRRKA